MIIKTYEAGKRGEACAALLAEHAPNYGIGKVTVLPIPSTRDGRCLKGSDIPIDNIAESAEEGELIVNIIKVLGKSDLGIAKATLD